jgi:acyl carrier protein
MLLLKESISMETDLKRKIEQRESTMLEVVEILISALHLKIQTSDLDPDTPLFGSGLGLDSVDAVVIIVELESRFKINISEEEGRRALRTVNSIIDLVLRKKYTND